MPDTIPANDAQLAQSVRQRFGRERIVGEDRVSVSSCSFVVTLHGTVASEERRGFMERIARAVPGVEDVENKLMIR